MIEGGAQQGGTPICRAVAGPAHSILCPITVSGGRYVDREQRSGQEDPKGGERGGEGPRLPKATWPFPYGAALRPQSRPNLRAAPSLPGGRPKREASTEKEMAVGKRKVGRSAITGRFVKKSTVRSNPRTTVTQTVKSRGRKRK